ncbi:hypothetical protein MP638_002957 [Amoeboaphelidium occidentale]|nr:hypothetical protein MP638_002957 [Amoeboaphelidium occidentale]
MQQESSSNMSANSQRTDDTKHGKLNARNMLVDKVHKRKHKRFEKDINPRPLSESVKASLHQKLKLKHQQKLLGSIHYSTNPYGNSQLMVRTETAVSKESADGFEDFKNDISWGPQDLGLMSPGFDGLSNSRMMSPLSQVLQKPENMQLKQNLSPIQTYPISGGFGEPFSPGLFTPNTTFGWGFNASSFGVPETGHLKPQTYTTQRDEAPVNAVDNRRSSSGLEFLRSRQPSLLPQQRF